MNSALPSSNSLLQKLQHLYSSHKKSNETSAEPKPIKPFTEINHLLEKSSPIPYMQISKPQYDIDQWTERILKQKVEKQQSCTSFTQNENDFHFQKTVSQYTGYLLAQIEKKVKMLKYAKENDHTTCAAIIAKMKLFCLDNSQTCYDFYRSTDLILLKYMVYLLIQELNQQQKPPQTEPAIDQTSQFQQMVKDVVSIVYEIIEEIKSKKYQGGSMDTLNKQLKQIQNKFKPQLNMTSKTISKSATHHHRFSSCNFETPVNKGTTEFNLSSDKFKSSLKAAPGSQKIIEYQIVELETKKQTINKLNEQIQKLQTNNKQQLLQISDLNNQISSLKPQIESKTLEVEQLEEQNKQLQTESLAYSQERDHFKNLYEEGQLACQELKSNYEQLQVSLNNIKSQMEEIHQGFEKYKQETSEYFQGQCTQLQQIKENEINQLKTDLGDKQSIIVMHCINQTQLLGDALYFGKQYKYIVENISQIPSDSMTKDLQQLQKELFVSENTFNAKLNALQNYQDNLLYDVGNEYLSQSQLSTSLANNMYQNQTGNFASISKNGLFSQTCSRKNSAQEYMQAQKGQYELMHMLLVQSQVLEKFLS